MLFKGRPFSDFPDLITLQRTNGLEIPFTYCNDKEAWLFTDFISLALKKELIKDIMKSDYISVLSDGSTDSSTQKEEIVYVKYLQEEEIVYIKYLQEEEIVYVKYLQEEIVYVMYLHDNCTPKTIFVALKALQKADADSIYTAIISTLEFDLKILN